MHKPTRTMSSREFNQSTGAAKLAALTGPVVVTDRGRPTHVLLSYDHYRRLGPGIRTLADMIGRSVEAGEVELELPERREGDGKAYDFDLRLRHVRRLLTQEGIDLADEQLMRDAWR